MNQTQDPELERPVEAAPDMDVTQAVPVPTVERTTMSANVECPVCLTPNPPSERYCIDCGFLLGEEPGEAEAIPEAPSFGSLVTPDGVREFPLRLGENTVGRENADILLAHNSVSRQHAKVTVSQGGASVVDTGSTNGTFIDGAKIEPDTPTELIDGAEMRFGNEVLSYKAPPPAEGIVQAELAAEAEEECIDDVAPAEEVAGEATTEVEESEPVAGIVGRLVSKDGSLSFDLCHGVYTIGRRQGDNDIVVPDPFASGRHADLEAGDGFFRVTDVGSSNGTTVNGVRVEPNTPVEVKAGDEIGIGQSAFRLEVV